VGGFHLHGASALPAEHHQRLEKVSQTSPCFEVLREQQRQQCITDIAGQTTKSFAWFCEEVGYRQVVLCPVLVRQNVVGVLGFFYCEKPRLSARLREEMQFAANLFLCAL
jgi:GAF domain-containing protein